MSRARKLFLALALLLAASFTFGSTASAQKVGNPGTINFKLTNGLMKVKNQEFGFDSSQNINFNGTVNAAGAISIPTITFPTYNMSASGFDLTIRINVVGPTTGQINPLNGDVSLQLRVWIKIDGVPLGGGCRIASASSPIALNALITGTSGPVSGTPYNPSNGTMRIVNGTYAVPTSSDCGIASGTVNDTVGLPSAAGQNTASFDITTAPVLTRAINPTFAATPTSGVAPATIEFSAAGTTVSSGPATYAWDFQNDGAFDQTGAANTASFTYNTGGTKTIRLRVTDSGGDWAETTRTVNITAFPDLAISATGDGEFTAGANGTYRVNLQNLGYATSGPVSVKTTLPAGLSFVSGSGAAWSCSATGQDVTCTRGGIVVGGTPPELVLSVAAGNEAYDSVSTTFTVETAGDSQASNNSAQVTTTVRAADLRVELNQVPHALLPGADPANQVELRARNVGNAPSTGTVTLANTFPAGLVPVSASGPGWNCAIDGQAVSCQLDAPVAAGSATEPVSVLLDATLEEGSAGAILENTATVTVPFDVNPANDSVSAELLVLDGPDLAVTKSHLGDFTAGKQESYELLVENLGPRSTSGGATVTDQLPEGLEFVSADGGPDWTCAEADGLVTCEHPAEIDAGQSAPTITLNVNVGVDAIPAVANTASVETDVDPNPANDESTSTAVVRAIDMTITKSHAGEIRVGENETFTLQVENVGDSATIAPVTVTDQLPAGLEFVSVDGGPDWACDPVVGNLVTCHHAASVAPGDQVVPLEVTTAVLPSAAPAVTNEASVTTPSDFNPANNEAIDSGDVIDVDAATSINRTGTFNPGQSGTYLLTVGNVGAVAAYAPLDVVAELGQGLEFESASGEGWTCSEDAGVVSCQGHDGIGPKTTAPAIQVRVNVTTGAVPSTTTVARATTVNDRFGPNDEASDTANVLGPDLAVSSNHEGPFRVGDIATWTLQVANAGPGTTTGPVTLIDELPAGFTYVRAQGDGWACGNAGSVVTCERSASIAPEAAVPPVTVEARVLPGALPAGEVSGNAENLARVETESEIAADDNETSDPTRIVGVDLGIEMAGPAETGVGETARFEVEVTSHSVANLGPIEVAAKLPVGVDARDFSGEGWNCEAAGRNFNCVTQASIAAGDSAPGLTLEARFGENAPASAVTETRLRTTGDVIATNDLATVTTATLARPDLEVSLDAVTAEGRFVTGSDGLYRATIRNRGSAATTGPVRASIDLPAGVKFVAVDHGGGWTCTSGPVCENAGPVAPDGVLQLGFRVDLDGATADAVATAIEVTTEGDSNDENNRAATETPLAGIDLAVSRQHLPVWTAGREGVYEVQVSNVGDVPTTSPVKLSERLPAGTEFRLATGEGWGCSVSGRKLNCDGPSVLEPGQTSVLRVTLALPGVPASFDAVTAISTAGDVNRNNDSVVESIEVGPAASTGVTRPARVTTSSVRSTRSGLVLLWVSCPKSSATRCSGRVQLATSGKVKLRNRRARIALGSIRFSIAPGRKNPVRIRLKKQGANVLKRLGRLSARTTVTNRGADQTRRVLTIRRAGR